MIDFDVRRRSDGVATRRPVVDGRVACPRRGRVDVLVCFACPLGRGLTTGHLERVVCALSDTDLDPRSAT